MEITMDGNNHPIEVDKAEVNVQRGMILGQLQMMKWVLSLVIALLGGGLLLSYEAGKEAHSERAEIRVSVAKLDERLIHVQEVFDERMSNMEGRLTKVESDMAIMKSDMAIMKGLLLQLVEQRKNN